MLSWRRKLCILPAAAQLHVELAVGAPQLQPCLGLNIADEYTKLEEDVNGFFKEFPKAEKWLKWYLNPKKAEILFPACRPVRASAKRV